MTKEQKDLLIKDLCWRLPYGVKMNHIADDEISPGTLIGIAKDMITLQRLGGYEYVPVEHYKPYLFPLDSMTEEQDKEFALLQTSAGQEGFFYVCNCANMMKWLIENHFDYNGLIPMGLANDATNLNIY